MNFSHFKKGLSGAVGLLFFIVNGPFVYSNETNFWAVRRAASEQVRRTNGEGGESGSSDGRRLSAQLPKTGPLDWGRSPSATPQENPRPKEPFSLGPKTGDWLGKHVLPYGSVREVYLSPDPRAPFIVHIQDAHGIEEAQRNISSMIGQLAQEPGIGLVGLEGASGSFSLETYRDYPDASITKDIADLFLKKGLIAGPEYAGLTLPNSPDFFGTEDNSLYTANVKALKDAYKGKQAAQDVLNHLQMATAKLKESHFSPDLKAFDRHFEAYHSDKEKLATYARYLLTTHQTLKSMKAVPNVGLLVKALDDEKSLDFKRVEEERRQLVDRLVRKLSTDQMQDLVAKSVDYRAGRMGYGDYHNHLKQVCLARGVKFAQWPQLNRYLDYVLLADKIDRNKLLDEMDLLDKSIPERLARNDKERQLVSLAFDLSLLAKLLRHEMSMGDWTAYEARISDIHRFAARLTELDPSIKANGFSGEMLKPYEDFCSYASQRNNALTDNLLRQIADTKGKSAVLVAGGFHTEGLSALLRKKRVSYAVVTPKISDIPKDNSYLDVLANDPVPLEKLLAGERIYLAKPVGLAASKNPSGRQVTALQQILQGGHKLVEYFNNRAFTTDPSLGEVLGRLTIGARTIYLLKNYRQGSSVLQFLHLLWSHSKIIFLWVVEGKWIKSGAIGLKPFVVALRKRLTITTGMAEGSFFIVRDLGNGTLEKEVKEIIGPKENSHQYKLSEKDRETVAQLTLEHIDLIRSAVQRYFNGKDLIPTFSIQGRRLTTNKVIGKSFFDLIKSNPRFATDLDWNIKTENLCQGAILAANAALGLSYGAQKILENGWKIEVDRTFTNFIFDDAGNLISWIDPISAWPPESVRIPEKTRPFYTPFFQSFGRRLAVIGFIVPLTETLLLLVARALLASLGLDPSEGIFLFSMGLFFASGHGFARSIGNKSFSVGEVLWWIGGGALFTHLLGFQNGFVASFAAHVVINSGLVVLRSVRIASQFPKIAALAHHIPYFSFMADSPINGKVRLLTDERLRRNRAISEHTKGIKSVLYLAAGFDLNNVLTTFPDATEVVMVGKEYETPSPKEVVDLMKKESLSQGALDYQTYLLENGFAPGTLVENKADQASFLALELLALNVDPASLEGSSNGIIFSVPDNSGGFRKIRVRFRNAQLGSRSSERKRGGISDLGVSHFDGLYMKAGESIGVELPIVLDQVSPLLNSQATLVLNNFSWNLRHTPGPTVPTTPPKFETRFYRTFSIPSASREDRLSLYFFTRTERPGEKLNPKIARTHLRNKFIRLRLLLEDRLAARGSSYRPLRVMYVSKDENEAVTAAGRSTISVRANRSLPPVRVSRDTGRKGKLEAGRIFFSMWTKSSASLQQEFPPIVFEFSTSSNYLQKSSGSSPPDLIIFIDENGSPEPLPSREAGKTNAGIDTFRVSDLDTPTLLNSLAQTFGGLNKGKPFAVNNESPRPQIKETHVAPTLLFWTAVKNGVNRFLDDVFRAPVREAGMIVSMDLQKFLEVHPWSGEGLVTRGLGWMGMGVIATVSLGLMAAAPFTVLLSFGLSQQVALIVSLGIAGWGAVVSPTWVMGSTLIAHIAQNTLARLMNPALKILGLPTIPLWNLEKPLAIDRRAASSGSNDIQLVINALSSPNDEYILRIHLELMATFDRYKKVAQGHIRQNSISSITSFWLLHSQSYIGMPSENYRRGIITGVLTKVSESKSKIKFDSLSVSHSGGFGDIWSAKIDDKPVVIKAVHFENSQTVLEEAILRIASILLEEKHLQRLDQLTRSGNMTRVAPRLIGTGMLELGHNAIIMEKIDGEPALVEGTGISLKDAVNYWKVLAALHEVGFVHGDIKPANIIPLKDEAILIDLGSAKEESDGYSLGDVTISQWYAAPEVPNGALMSSDVYSMAGTLIDLLPIGISTREDIYPHLLRAIKGFPSPGTENGTQTTLRFRPTAKEMLDLFLSASMNEHPIDPDIESDVKMRELEDARTLNRNLILASERNKSMEKFYRKRLPYVNNFFIGVLGLFFRKDVAVQWGMRLLPVEMGVIISAAFMDPFGLGVRGMVAGLALFKLLHYGLQYVQFLTKKGERPVLSLSGFAKEFRVFLPYVALPLLAHSAVLFSAWAIVSAYLHYSYDSKVLAGEKTAGAIVRKIQSTENVGERMALNAVVGALMTKGKVSDWNLNRLSSNYSQQDLTTWLEGMGNQEAIKVLKGPEVEADALEVLARLMAQEGESTKGREVRDLMNFETWKKSDRDTVRSLIKGSMEAGQHLLFLHGSGNTETVLDKLGISLTPAERGLIDTQKAEVGISMSKIILDYKTRTGGQGIPLASTVLVQNDQSVMMDLTGFQIQKYSDLSKSIQNAINTMIAVMQAA